MSGVKPLTTNLARSNCLSTVSGIYVRIDTSHHIPTVRPLPACLRCIAQAPHAVQSELKTSLFMFRTSYLQKKRNVEFTAMSSSQPLQATSQPPHIDRL